LCVAVTPQAGAELPKGGPKAKPQSPRAEDWAGKHFKLFSKSINYPVCGWR
jgi:hypothetical protein